ncbi:MAG: 50S ribosomal protein L3 [Deltaproteobacteria bacterium]|nr:50S ribosomal protein L3 [Deltaproteobacteria bacterium]
MSDGILGRKLGMTQIFDISGNSVPVTVIQAGPCVVLRKKSAESDGYSAIQLAFEPLREKLLTKPRLGEFHSRGKQPMRFLREFRMSEEDLAEYTEGEEIRVDLFSAGELVDVIGTSKGRGFSGVMKRHHFKGGKDSHGVHEYFRHGGSIGTSATPGRVAKGRKMAGQHGNARVTVQNLTVLVVDVKKNLIMVRGAVPGANNGMVIVRRAVKG